MQIAMHIFCAKRNIINLKGGNTMSFQIKPDKKETENKTIRFPLPLIDEIENVIKANNVTFSGFVLQACRYALDNLDMSTNKE